MRFWPATEVGMIGMGCATLACVLFGVEHSMLRELLLPDIVDTRLDLYEMSMVVLGLSGSVCALVALQYQRDYAWGVYIGLVPLLSFIAGLLSLLWR